MKEFSIKRFTASLLFIVMVVAALPASLFGFTIGAAAAEEKTVYVLAGSDFQASSDSAGQTIVSNILAQIQKDYPTMHGFLFAGDYTVNYNSSQTISGKNALQKTVQNVYGTDLHEIYVQGNHDDDSTVSSLTSSGAHDAAEYGVFVINEKDYMWFNNEEATIKATAENLKAYLDAKRDERYTKPVFVVSHLPLHYSMRTQTSGNGDGKYANYLFDVLNEAGNAGLNIIFLFGHNHSHGWDDYLGGAAIYLTRGDSINIAQASTTEFKAETLAFTYMNAGYVGYYGTSYVSSVDKTLTMTTFAITDDSVTVSRYDADGKHNLESTGVYNVEYPDSAYYALDTTVTGSPAVITLNKSVTPSNGMPDLGGSNGGNDNNAGGDGEDSDNGGDVNGTAGEWVLVSEPTNGGIIYTLDTDGIDAGEKYLIVSTSSNGTGHALTNNNSNSAGDTTVTIADQQIIVDDDTKINWIFSGSSSGTVKNQNRYVYLSWDNTLNTSSRNLTLNNRSNGAYRISYSNRYLRYNHGWSSSTNSSGRDVYLFKYTGTEPGNDGVYYRIVGSLAYEANQGTSAEAVLNLVKSGVDVYTYTGTNPGAGEIGTLVSDSDVTWTLSENYEGAPGEYTVTITKDGKELGVATVTVPEKQIVKCEVDPAVGSVSKGAKRDALVGAIITVTLEDDSTYTVPVTVSMLTHADGSAVSTGALATYENLTLTFRDMVVTENFTLNVTARAGNNYPEYPNEGSVKVSKTATGVDFQSSGVAQVEISASGEPARTGSDVIVMLDLSSSMNNTVDGKTRLQVLKESLQTLLSQLQANDSEGNPMDIRIAVADFHAYYSNTDSPYYYDSNDRLDGTKARSTSSPTNLIYTGSQALNAGAFVDVHTLANNAFDGLTYNSGTNYDYAFDAVYQLGQAITAENATAGENRDLFVIFMSDGAPFQYNYFTCQTGYGNAAHWNNWLTGTVTEDMFWDGARNDYYNPEGKHWMAEAVKGDPTRTYPVIRKNDLTDENEDNWVEVSGLGAKLYSIGFCLADDKEVVTASMQTVIRNIASDSTLYFEANSADDLNTAFTTIGGDINYAASNARYVDQMGENFNLQMATTTYEVVENGSAVSRTLTPKIEIISYDIYTRQDYLNGTIAENQIGTRKGTSTILETVTFTQATGEDGNVIITGAYSDQVDGGQTNILVDGVICARNFWYNTSRKDAVVEGISIPTVTSAAGITSGSSNVLPAETFYWNMGTVRSTELALRYYVYLDGSMEGTREAGSYPTNEYATLYYDNYLGNPCRKETVSPVMAWKEANVSYAFYLVDENGRVIVNQTTGETGSFANKIAVTNPVVYGTVMLNSTADVSSLSVASRDVLPEGYTLFDTNGTEGAEYMVEINSNSTGNWEITSLKKVATTYVVNYNTEDPSAYSNATSESSIGLDYTHTLVWFAVVWKVQALPDTVVIDYGLPVDISVLSNDMFGENGKLAALGAASEDLNLTGYDNALAEGFGDTFTGIYGDAEMDNTSGHVRYTLNTMSMDSYEKFAYAVRYIGQSNPGYYYSTVTVIPATSIYYEESFVTFTDSNIKNGTYGKWEDVGKNNSVEIQDEDRPGKQSLAEIDHNNLYGYDDINARATTFSLGAAKKVSVNSEVGNHKEKSPTATFTFTGTGFDIISMTNSDSGAIFITAEKDVKGDEKEYTVNKFIDNYYGYKYEEESGVWTPDPNDGAVYQVPVMKIADLPYGTYKVTIWVTYGELFDHDSEAGYSFWLDSIRIYDPAGDVYDGDDQTIANAYKADGEAYPKYLRIKDAILDPANINPDDILPGAVFIDGCESTNDVALYKNPGPNNEAYLAPEQSISFKLKANAKPVDVQLGAKLAFGESVNLELSYTIDKETQKWLRTISTATDMYYTIKQYLTNTDSSDGWATGTITITNVSTNGAVASLTNIKATFETDTVLGGSTSNASSTARTMNLDQTASEPVQIFMLVDDQVVEDAIAVMRELYAPKPTVFTPEVLEYTVTRGLFGYYTVNVITSKDVASLTVNGQAAKLVNNSLMFGTLIKLVDNITDKSTISNYNIWTVTLKGASEYDIVAIDENGLSSKPQAAASGSSIDREDIMNYIQSSELYRIMKELADKRFDPESFEAYVNERLDGLREIITKTSEDVEYVIIDGRIVDRYITETIIDTATGEETVRRIWIAEPAEGSDEVEVNAYNENGIGSASKWASFGFMPSAVSGKSFSELFGKM